MPRGSNSRKNSFSYLFNVHYKYKRSESLSKSCIEDRQTPKRMRRQRIMIVVLAPVWGTALVSVIASELVILGYNGWLRFVWGRKRKNFLLSICRLTVQYPVQTTDHLRDKYSKKGAFREGRLLGCPDL